MPAAMRLGVNLAAAAVLVAWAAPALAARPPVVVELFTSQGCASCGDASAHAAKLAQEKGVLELTWSVDYWDYLGWKDTFAKPEFADRQRAYATRLGVAEVFTPQVVVDGRDQASAAKAADVDRLVREARHFRLDPPQMQFRGDKVAVGSGRVPRGGAEIWLVRYDPRAQTIDIKDGDNRGHTVTEANVVVELDRLGAWHGRPILLAMPAASQPGLRTAVLVEGAKGGPILGVIDEAPAPSAPSS